MPVSSACKDMETLDWYQAGTQVVLAITSGLVVAVFTWWATEKRQKQEERRQFKLKSFTELLNNSRAFLDDPNLELRQKGKMKDEFIKKYYDEIILFADKEVQDKIEAFIEKGGVSVTNPSPGVSRLKEMIAAIRNDLGFGGHVRSDFKMYSSNNLNDKDENH